MKITLLGSGSAYGTPMIFNDWRLANPANPKNIRTRAAVLIAEAGKTILVDAGPDIRAQVNTNQVENIDAVFLTHGHYDHIAGIPELPRAAKILGHGIDVFASEETFGEVKKSFGYLFKEKVEAEPDSKKLNWKTLPTLGEFDCLGLKFKTFQVPHHSLHSSAFRLGDFAYVTDWEGIPAEGLSVLQGVKTLLIECNNGLYPEKNGHSDLENVKKIAALVKPERVILTHLSARVDYDQTSAVLPDNFELAYDGMSFEA